MDDFLRVLKAVSNRNRLRIIKMLQERPLCVCEIREILGVSQPSVSRHLNILKEAGILVGEKNGVWIDYRINDSAENIYLESMLESIKDWFGDDEVIIEDRNKLAKVDRREICSIAGGPE